MLIGAGVGALAGLVVHGVKCALSKEQRWNWRDAAAHAAGGLVGGALFPPLVAALGAVGLPAGAAYVLSGGVAWGGVWSLAQDVASKALGRSKQLGSPKKYLINTAIGVVATALLLPLASRVIGPAGSLARHAGSVEAFIAPPRQQVVANVLKAEAEFLAYGAFTEGTSAGAVALTALARPQVVAGVVRAETGLLTKGALEGTSAGAVALTSLTTSPVTTQTSSPGSTPDASESEPAQETSPFQALGQRVLTDAGVAPADDEVEAPALGGLIDVVAPLGSGPFAPRGRNLTASRSPHGR